MAATLQPGSLDDRVKLVLRSKPNDAPEEILIAESWDVVEGILETPGAFALTLGQSQPVAAYFTNPGLGQYPGGGPKYPKGTPFQLYIGEALQMSGVIEGYRVNGKATRITIKGRDALASLMRTHSEKQRSFLDGTYRDLVTWAIEEAGITGYTLDSTNAANRLVKAGIPISVISEPTTVDQINSGSSSAAAGKDTTGIVVGNSLKQEKQNRIHENLLAFIRRHLDRTGLFLWAGARRDSFVLGQPNGAQQPSGRIIRKRSAPLASSNVVDVDYVDDCAHRHGSCTVYGRGGGGKDGRTKAKGATVDPEMRNLDLLTGSGWTNQGILYRDCNVDLVEQAEFFALRKLAEERRNGWSLTYTVRGHRLQTPDGSAWGVITPDTVIYVEDDEIGLKDSYYVESVRRMRRPETVTEVRLMRIEDLIFGTDEQ